MAVRGYVDAMVELGNIKTMQNVLMGAYDGLGAWVDAETPELLANPIVVRDVSRGLRDIALIYGILNGVLPERADKGYITACALRNKIGVFEPDEQRTFAECLGPVVVIANQATGQIATTGLPLLEGEDLSEVLATRPTFVEMFQLFQTRTWVRQIALNMIV